jgi:hypothetical protein
MVFKESWLHLFVTFVVAHISKAKGRDRNPMMRDLERKFVDKHRQNSSAYSLYKRKRGVGYVLSTGVSLSNVCAYGVEIRKYLEILGYITCSPLNHMDRRIRYLSPTPSFPSYHQKARLNALTEATYRSIADKLNLKSRVYYARNKKSKTTKEGR